MHLFSNRLIVSVLSFSSLVFLGIQAAPNRVVKAAAAKVTGLKVKGLTTLPNDSDAYKYAKNNSNTYIAIIWPRARKNQDFILNSLKKCAGADVVYTKDIKLNENGAWNFYKNAHRGSSNIKTKKALKNYFKNIKAPYPLKAVMIQTSKPLSQLITCKRGIRQKLGISFWSLHINDTHKETMEMADVVFNDARINAIQKMKKIK